MTNVGYNFCVFLSILTNSFTSNYITSCCKCYFQRGHTIDAGYLGFDLPLHTAPSVHFGAGAENVLAVRVDSSFGSGHWYEVRARYLMKYQISTVRQYTRAQARAHIFPT